MGMWKLVQLICMAITWLMAPLIQVANRKFNQKDNKGHNWLFWLLVSIWFAAGGGLGLATWKDFVGKEKAPALTLFLNNHRMDRENYVVLPSTNGIGQLHFWVLNMGGLVSDEVLLRTCFPPQIEIMEAPGWTVSKLIASLADDNLIINPTNIGPALGVNYDQHYLAAHSAFACSPLAIKCTRPEGGTNLLRVYVSSKNAAPLQTSIWFELKEGISNASASDGTNSFLPPK